MREAIIAFFDDNVAWLTRVLEQGEAERSLRLTGSPSDAAQTILSGLEGALLVARPYADVARFESAAARLLSGLAQPAPDLSGVRPNRGSSGGPRC